MYHTGHTWKWLLLPHFDITNLNINLDLYASDIRKRQAHPYLYGVEVSVGEPHKKCFTSSESQNVIAYADSMWS